MKGELLVLLTTELTPLRYGENHYYAYMKVLLKSHQDLVTFFTKHPGQQILNRAWATTYLLEISERKSKRGNHEIHFSVLVGPTGEFFFLPEASYNNFYREMGSTLATLLDVVTTPAELATYLSRYLEDTDMTADEAIQILNLQPSLTEALERDPYDTMLMLGEDYKLEDESGRLAAPEDFSSHANFVIYEGEEIYLLQNKSMKVVSSKVYNMLLAFRIAQLAYDPVRTIFYYLGRTASKKHDLEPLYSTFEIPKSDGSKRTIYAPNETFKKYSRGLNRLLTNRLESRLTSANLEDIFTGYRNFYNVQFNAHAHKGSKKVVKMDLKKFFDHLTYGEAGSYLIPLLGVNKLKSRDFRRRYDDIVKKMANVQPKTSWKMCFNAQRFQTEVVHPLVRDYFFQPLGWGLYTGNPVSGTIGNLYMIKVAKYLRNLIKEKDIHFTIYADDITFSGADVTAAKCNWYMTKVIEDLDLGIEINPEKTRTMRNQKRRVTGIRINHQDIMTWDRHHYDKIRVALHKLSHGTPIQDLPFKSLNEFRGQLAFLMQTARANYNGDPKVTRLLEKYQAELLRYGLIGENQLVSYFRYVRKENPAHE